MEVGTTNHNEDYFQRRNRQKPVRQPLSATFTRGIITFFGDSPPFNGRDRVCYLLSTADGSAAQLDLTLLFRYTPLHTLQ